MYSKTQKLTLMSLSLIHFISYCSMSLMAPFFPKEAMLKGMTESTCGMVFSFHALVMVITAPLYGKMLPFCNIKFVFGSGILVAGCCNILFGILGYIDDYELFTMFCFLVRGFGALGTSAFSTVSFVFIINAFPDTISSVLGIMEIFIGLGMSVGPAIGGFLYSVGGFGLPFYALGVTMIVTLPLNHCLLKFEEGYKMKKKSGSIMKMLKVPSVLIICFIITVISNTWAFLDPTLEPHFRQFNLPADQIGLIFLLLSAFYAISSPFWGKLANRINRQWRMFVWGLLFCTFGLLLLGPSPLFPFLKSSLLINLIGLSIIGISISLTLIPTFQVLLSNCIKEGNCENDLTTYGLVAGIWNSMYSLGDVTGPSLGGIFLRTYGFPICSTIMASFTFSMAILVFIFFVVKERCFSKCRKNISIIISDEKSNNNKSYNNEELKNIQWKQKLTQNYGSIGIEIT